MTATRFFRDECYNHYRRIMGQDPSNGEMLLSVVDVSRGLYNALAKELNNPDWLEHLTVQEHENYWVVYEIVLGEKPKPVEEIYDVDFS